MAIKVNGTTVVDDSRNLTNIASVDATTVAALSAAGVGDITAVTAGSGLTGGGTSGAVTINHQDTSSQGSVNNSGNTVIQDVTLDTYGHITNINSTTISTTPPTTFGAVGTYVFAHGANGTSYTKGATTAGSNLGRTPVGITNAYFDTAKTSLGVSGTWRYMMGDYGPPASWSAGGIWLRIS